MAQAARVATSSSQVLQVVTQHGKQVFETVSDAKRPQMHWSGGVHRGNFTVQSTEPIPDLNGQTLEITRSDGTNSSVVVTKVVGNIVYFRSRGPGSA